jgi:hypothetical protein
MSCPRKSRLASLVRTAFDNQTWSVLVVANWRSRFTFFVS